MRTQREFCQCLTPSLRSRREERGRQVRKEVRRREPCFILGSSRRVIRGNLALCSVLVKMKGSLALNLALVRGGRERGALLYVRL